MPEFNIVGTQFEPLTDLKLFYTDHELKTHSGDIPLTPLVESDKTMAHLIVRLGKFASVGEAKRNGWDIPIPVGWSEFTIGKAKNRMDLFIWNPELSMSDWMIKNESELDIVAYFSGLYGSQPYSKFVTWVGNNSDHKNKIREDLTYSHGVDVINTDRLDWRVCHSYRWLKE